MSSPIAFPGSLPAPLPNYTVAFLGRRNTFETETGHTIRRRKTSVEIRQFRLEWRLSGSEFNIFRDWFYSALADGTRSFDILLLDDSTTEQWFTVRVPTATYQASLEPGMLWNVQMEVLSTTLGFTDRTPGSADLSGLSTLQFSANGELVDPGINLLGRTNLEITATGILYSTTRALATIEITATGVLPKIYRGFATIELSSRGYLYEVSQNYFDADGDLIVSDDDTHLESDR